MMESTPARLLENADAAMYQAKQNGRQGYRFFTPAMNTSDAIQPSIEQSSLRTPNRQMPQAQ